MPTLYIVATPIGNLEDISMRALRVLGEVDFILCEDTRVTRVLLDRYNIKTRTISYHQHSNENKVSEIINLLIQGKNLALVSDAGTPGISDPGGKLVQAVLEKFGSEIYPVKSPLKRGAEQFYGVNPVKSRSAGITPEAELFDGVKIESVPGPSAVTAALSISGIPTDKFIFLGFPPHKKGRQTFIRKILVSDYPVVVYESKHRIVKFLQELQEAVEKNLVVDGEKANQELGIRNNGKGKTPSLTSVVVCRELSKMHETVYRGDLKSIMEKIKLNKNDQKGEFVVIIGK
ncbi:MAG: ribosomal RNA small subunit methyltransferase I [bacterium]|nr:ribosomal RNA small subunit methyltransferase I [bacterium]